VRRAAELGLVLPGEEGRFAAGDVVVVRFVASLEEAGIRLEDVAAGVASGDIDYTQLGAYFAEPPPARETLEELAGRVGRSPELVARLVGALGLVQPRPGDRVREDEAELVGSLVAAWELLEDEELVRLARFQGEAMRRLAAVSIRFFEELVRQRVLRLDATSAEKDALVQRLGERATVVAHRLVGWLFDRHFELALVQYMAENTEEYLDARGIRPRPAPRPPAIAFLDLTGYTSLTEERGDEAAAQLASRLALVVDDVSRAHGGQVVKWLGDGVMIHFHDPASAVRCALDLVRRASDAVDVPARVGVDAGPVVFQEGDYFGRTVNVAARIADHARPREVLVSGAVLAAAEHPGVSFAAVGDVSLKGVSAPVPLHRAVAGVAAS
jgi:class 3 adenylate cyclase